MTPTKTIVITGANSGIGRATAEILAAKGYNIITICRKKAEGEKMVAALLKINPKINAENFTADLSDLEQVAKTAHAIKEKYTVIDRLINNAGYYPPSIEYIGNIEKSFVASHLGHMLLTQLLRPCLQKSNESRVINLSSALHSGGKAKRFFQHTANMQPGDAYADSKLANILFSMALAKDLPANVSGYSLHPGVVRTNFESTVTGALKIAIVLFKPFFLTPEKGAATSVYLADAPIETLSAHRGKYFEKKKPASTNNADVTDENAATLWKNSLEVLRPYLK
jgi:retinol dehydrogenase-12